MSKITKIFTTPATPKTEQVREELHKKEIELEKMKLELKQKKSPVQRFWEWLGL